MGSKLGLYIGGAGGNLAGFLNQAAALRPRALLVRENAELLNALYDRLGAGPVYLYQPDIKLGAGDYVAAFPSPQAAAEDFLNRIEAGLQNLRWAYLVPPFADSPTPALIAFDAALIEIAAGRNLRVCVGNYAAGTDWAAYRRVLELAARHSALIGLQERYPLLPYVNYGPPNSNLPASTASRLQNEIPYPQKITSPGPLIGRYRHLRDFCRQNQLPVRIIITAAGAGRVLPAWLDRFGANLGDWRSLGPAWQRLGYGEAGARYAQDLIWMDQHVYLADPEVLGVCIYAWGLAEAPQADLAGATSLLDRLAAHARTAQATQAPPHTAQALPSGTRYRVIVPRLRIRALPSLNTKIVGGFDYGEEFTATAYTFYDGQLWLQHPAGWSVYTPLQNGEPEYDNKYVEGRVITTPRQEAAAQNFVGTMAEVKQFLAAHRDQLFYIAINPNTPPVGARQFSVTVFPAGQGRRIIDQLHPAAGDPLMTPEARKRLREAGQG